MSIKFDSEPVYDDNDKYIKTKIKICEGNLNTILKVKKYQEKMHHMNVYH